MDNPGFLDTAFKIKKDQYIGDLRRNHRNNVLDKRRFQFFSEENKTIDHKTFLEINDNSLEKAKHALQNLLIDLNSNEKYTIHMALIALRKISDDDPNFLSFISPNGPNFIAKLIELASLEINPDIQVAQFTFLQNKFESLRILANLTLEDSSACYFYDNQKYIALILKAFDSFNQDVNEILLLGLGNILGDSSSIRNIVLEHGIIDKIINYIENFSSKNGIWALCNLIRGHNLPDTIYYQKVLTVLLNQLLGSYTQGINDVDEDYLWTILELSEKINITNYLLTEDKYLIGLIQLLDTGKAKIISPVLKILANVLCNNSKTVYNICESYLLSRILKLFDNPNFQIRLDNCYLLSSLVSIHLDNLFDLLMKFETLPKLLYLIKTNHRQILKQCLWIINEITKHADDNQFMILYKLGCLEVVSELLSDIDPTILLTSLEILHNFLQNGQKKVIIDQAEDNFYALKLEALGAIKNIEALQDSSNENVYNQALKLLEAFFITEEINQEHEKESKYLNYSKDQLYVFWKFK